MGLGSWTSGVCSSTVRERLFISGRHSELAPQTPLSQILGWQLGICYGLIEFPFHRF